MLARNKLYGATHLVFELRKQDQPPAPAESSDALSLCSYRTWDTVPEEMKAAMIRSLDGQYWGKEQWMQLGWRLWIGTMGRELALVSWTREAGGCEDFFFPMSADCAMIWQTITVPAFRGRGLCAAAFRRIAAALFESGFARVYCSCRDYNISSRKAIEKAGFQCIGRGVVAKRTGQGVWHPVARPFTQG